MVEVFFVDDYFLTVGVVDTVSIIKGQEGLIVAGVPLKPQG